MLLHINDWGWGKIKWKHPLLTDKNFYLLLFTFITIDQNNVGAWYDNLRTPSWSPALQRIISFPSFLLCHFCFNFIYILLKIGTILQCRSLYKINVRHLWVYGQVIKAEKCTAYLFHLCPFTFGKDLMVHGQNSSSIVAENSFIDKVFGTPPESFNHRFGVFT